jgi:hypothetical protein
MAIATKRISVTTPRKTAQMIKKLDDMVNSLSYLVVAG